MTGESALVPAKGTVAVPVKQNLGRGHEEVSEMDELEIPRAKLVQFTSGEAQADNKEDRRDPGTLINSITKEELGSEFIPIYKFTNFIQWNPRKKDDPNFDPAYEPGAIIFSTDNRRDPRVIEGIKFGDNGESPKVTKYMNFLCSFINHPYPVVLSFAKSSFNAGKRLNTLTQFSGGDMFSNVYRMSIKSEENNGTKYFKFEVAPSRKASPEEFKTAERWFEDFHGKSIKVTDNDPVATDAWTE